MNLSDYERLAARVIDADPGSITESSQVEQLVAACKGGKALAVMDALFRHAAHGLVKRLASGTDLHSTPMIVGTTGDLTDLSEPEIHVLAVLASYACGDPDHAFNALLEYHDNAHSPAEAQLNIAALIRVAKAVHSGRIEMKEEPSEDS